LIRVNHGGAPHFVTLEKSKSCMHILLKKRANNKSWRKGTGSQGGSSIYTEEALGLARFLEDP